MSKNYPSSFKSDEKLEKLFKEAQKFSFGIDKQEIIEPFKSLEEVQLAISKTASKLQEALNVTAIKISPNLKSLQEQLNNLRETSMSIISSNLQKESELIKNSVEPYQSALQKSLETLSPISEIRKSLPCIDDCMDIAETFNNSLQSIINSENDPNKENSNVIEKPHSAFSKVIQKIENLARIKIKFEHPTFIKIFEFVANTVHFIFKKFTQFSTFQITINSNNSTVNNYYITTDGKEFTKDISENIEEIFKKIEKD